MVLVADGAITPAVEMQNPTTVLLWSVGRAVEIWAGMRIAGENDRPVMRAIAGSVAVQAGIWLWSKMGDNMNKALPSIEAVQKNKVIDMFLSYLMRAGIMAGGMYVAGFRKNVIRDGLAGAFVTEVTVIAMNGNAP
jgi:hypothetical protein